MKILWLAHRDPMNPKAGGAERTIYEVCTRLSSRGNEVTLLTGGWDGCIKNEHIDGIKIRRYGKRAMPHLILPSILLHDNFDVVINDMGHAVPWPSAPILSRANIVFFRHLHARSLKGQVNFLLASFLKALERSYPLIYRKEIFVTESSTSKSDLIKMGIGEERIVIIPPGVNSDLFRPSKKTDFPSIVYFGGMRKYKRPEESLYLLSTLRDRIDGIRLFLVGDGPQLNALRELSKKLGVEDNVIFTGRLDYNELAMVVSSSWLNIHSSITEGWGLSVIEASSAGTPTVAYDVPGISDTVENGINGLKVRDGDRSALAEAAMNIISSPERLWSSSLQVAKKYSWERTANMWEDLIFKVANKQHK